jgi:prolyl oligopeptidase
MKPPIARVSVVRETYFGTTIDDPYRWMEDWQSEEALSWLEGQAAYAREVLDALPGREALLARITELSGASPVLSSFQVAAGRTFYLRRDPGENVPKLVLRASSGAPERVLLDPNAMPGQVHSAIDWYAPSWDGRHVAYGISQGGSEDSTLRVLEVETGRTLDLAIDHTIYGGVCWLDDHRSFLYNRSPEPSSDGEYSRYLNSRTYLHRLGDDPRGDVPVFGRDAHPDLTFAAVDIPFVIATPASPWMIGMIMHGDLRELTLYTAPAATLADPARIPWTRIAGVAEEVTGCDFAGDTIYLLTHKDAPRYKVVATSLRRPDAAHATVVAAEGRAVIEDVRVAGEHLLLRDVEGGISRMRRVRRAGGEPEPIALPVAGSVTEWAGERTSEQVLLQLTSWTASPRVYRCDVASSSLEDTGWSPPSPVDFGAIASYEVEAPARDGTLVPLSIVHRRGLARDGTNPTLLMGYGSYGITFSPRFMPSMLAWYERGGVLAIAHVRGGGEHGDAWHKAGQKLNKEHTIGDFIACAEYLIFEGYTTPRRLAGRGGSAGGIPTGGALVRRPDLWAAMVMNVPVTNALRFETTENGPPNVLELGSVTSEEGFRGLQIIDSYARVRDGVAYPAVLVTCGLNDPRVVVWMATKMVARLQAATSSDKPVLLRVEREGGHGMGSTRQQVDEELADTLAFLFWQMGA